MEALIGPVLKNQPTTSSVPWPSVKHSVWIRIQSEIRKIHAKIHPNTLIWLMRPVSLRFNSLRILKAGAVKKKKERKKNLSYVSLGDVFPVSVFRFLLHFCCLFCTYPRCRPSVDSSLNDCNWLCIKWSPSTAALIPTSTCPSDLPLQDNSERFSFAKNWF